MMSLPNWECLHFVTDHMDVIAYWNFQINRMSHDMRFPTMWFVRPAKPQISLRIRAVWSEPLLVAWIFHDCWATDWTPFEVSKLNRRLHRLVCVYTCQNLSLLEITYRGSYVLSMYIYCRPICYCWVPPSTKQHDYHVQGPVLLDHFLVYILFMYNLINYTIL